MNYFLFLLKKKKAIYLNDFFLIIKLKFILNHKTRVFLIISLKK